MDILAALSRKESEIDDAEVDLAKRKSEQIKPSKTS